MIWYSAVFICFDEVIGKYSKETTNPCLCWGGDVRIKHGVMFDSHIFGQRRMVKIEGKLAKSTMSSLIYNSI